MTHGESLTPAEVILLTPCVKTYRYGFNRGEPLAFGSRMDGSNELEPYVSCRGNGDDCVGGTLGWPPDPISQQNEFARAMGRMCTAADRFIREKNGVTTKVNTGDE